MSATTHISAHADYHRSDYIFSRTQSRALSQREWEGRLPGLRSWGSVIIPAVTTSAAVAVALAVLS
jgi:hypothetical protein